MVEVFTSLSDTLRLTIQDATSPSTSAAYITFFKDLSYAPYVRTILTNALTGTAVQPGVPGIPPASPQAVCVKSPGQLEILRGKTKLDMYLECIKNSSVRSYSLTGDSLIVICPSFFDVPKVPPPDDSNCLSVSGFLNRFLGPGRQLIDYQVYVLLHVIVHYYIYAASQTRFDHYDINTCFHLGALESSQNAQNYAFYAASELLFS